MYARTLQVFLLTAMAVVLLATIAIPSHASPPTGYTLVWHDEFNSATDPNETVGSGLDPAYWEYTTGNDNGFGNNELQTYVTDTSHVSIQTDSTAPNGTALYITATDTAGVYESGRVDTEISNVIGTQPQYGYFESTIEQPIGSGLWPAWWMIGEDYPSVGWPECGEQDIFEQFEANPTNQLADFYYNATDYDANYGGSVTVTTGVYNTYGLLWTPTTQADYYNGTAYATNANVGGPFMQPFFFIYNLAVGGNPGAVGANTVFPSSLKVGYLRVYQANGSVQTASNAADNTPPVVAGGSAAIATGNYQVTPEVTTTNRLDLVGNGTADGTGIDAYASNGTAGQAWAFTTAGVSPSGDYSISAVEDGNYCIQAGGWSNESTAEIWGCDGSNLQSWNVVATTAPYYEIHPASSNSLCLYDGYISSTNEAMGVHLQTCDSTTSDQWSFTTDTGLTAAPPAGVTAAPGNAQITLSWSSVSAATSYNVYRGTSSYGEALTPYKNLTTTSYTNTGLTNGTTYFYTVGSANSVGTSVWSAEVSATPGTSTAPATPTGLAATPGNAQNALAWGTSSGATSYNLYRSTVSGGEGTTAYKTGLTSAAYADAGLTNGTAYYYTVAAVNSLGTSAQSSQVSGTPAASGSAPAAPASLTATAGNALATLTWGASSGASTYNLYRSTVAGGEGTTPYYTGISTTAYTNTGLTNGTTYYYMVAAVNSTGTSAQSGQVSATPAASGSAPAAPASLTATAGSALVMLNWGASTGATTYNLYRSTVGGGEGTTPFYTGISTTSYTNTGLTNGTAYYYMVAAVNSSGTSTQSGQASATPASTGSSEVIEIACGGAAASPFVADTDYVGGTATTVTNTINTTGVTNPAPVAVYKSNRYGAFTYTIPGLTAGATYTVRLHFAEGYFTAIGLRTFDVTVNGTPMLTIFDIFGASGAEYKANVQQMNTSANSSGQIVITTTNVINNAQINGIEILTN
jgi:fibronectin type 3 domain-containing protein/beta-glucanase (GH16 family)